MKVIKFKRGDFVFVVDKDGGHQPTKVWGVTKKRVLVENWEKGEDEFGNARPVARYISPDKVQLQSEWAKENGADYAE